MLFVYSGNEVWPSEGVCLPNVIKNAFNILTSIGFEFYLFNETRFRSYLGIFGGISTVRKLDRLGRSQKKKFFFLKFFYLFSWRKTYSKLQKKENKISLLLKIRSAQASWIAWLETWRFW